MSLSPPKLPLGLATLPKHMHHQQLCRLRIKLLVPPLHTAPPAVLTTQTHGVDTLRLRQICKVDLSCYSLMLL